MGAPEFVQDGQAALARADWARARVCFERALERDAQSPEALDGLGRALHFEGEYGRAIELTERAFAAYLGAGRGVEAADRARWLGVPARRCPGEHVGRGRLDGARGVGARRR